MSEVRGSVCTDDGVKIAYKTAGEGPQPAPDAWLGGFGEQLEGLRKGA